MFIELQTLSEHFTCIVLFNPQNASEAGINIICSKK